MLKTGLIGWRGMVGSVLIERMFSENNFRSIHPYFFSTSQAGSPNPLDISDSQPLMDAFDISCLRGMDVIITCQGSGYTKQVYPQLRGLGWAGYWIDAASALRLNYDAIIVLDPINRRVIDGGLESGIKNFIGGNCTVSLMLMGLGGLFKEDLVEWASSMTYQAASGAGSNNMWELITQMGRLEGSVSYLLNDPKSSILEIDRLTRECIASDTFPKTEWKQPLAGNLLPWIDSEVGNGQSREEFKNQIETNKILGRCNNPIALDGLCVRVGAMRSHSQAVTLKLRQDVPLDDVHAILANTSVWTRVVQNKKDASLTELTPAAVSGTLQVAVGRIRKMNMGGQYLSAFTVGDQLLWGAAEPLRRILEIIIEFES